MNCPMCIKWKEEPKMRIAELKYCYLMLNQDQFFPGYSLLFTKEHITETFYLKRAARGGVVEELNRVAEVLFKIFEPAKINYELLGNMVPHMHWHIVPRFTTDSCWPNSIWSKPHKEVMLSSEEYKERIELIREGL
ncbi:MAG: HIT family protein [Desulfuromonadales bacterium]|nr:HIT family protein [Desulfuromonadales bacterium]